MPLYVFQSEDGVVQDIFFSMSDAPAIGSTIELDGVKWRRILTKPNMSVDTQNNPFSSKDFNKNLENKKVTIGDMWDASKEASEKRAAKCGGVDPVKQNYYNQYTKDHKGIKHHTQVKEENGKTTEMIKETIKKTLGT